MHIIEKEQPIWNAYIVSFSTITMVMMAASTYATILQTNAFVNLNPIPFYLFLVQLGHLFH